MGRVVIDIQPIEKLQLDTCFVSAADAKANEDVKEGDRAYALSVKAEIDDQLVIKVTGRIKADLYDAAPEFLKPLILKAAYINTLAKLMAKLIDELLS